MIPVYFFFFQQWSREELSYRKLKKPSRLQTNGQQAGNQYTANKTFSANNFLEICFLSPLTDGGFPYLCLAHSYQGCFLHQAAHSFSKYLWRTYLMPGSTLSLWKETGWVPTVQQWTVRSALRQEWQWKMVTGIMIWLVLRDWLNLNLRACVQRTTYLKAN